MWGYCAIVWLWLGGALLYADIVRVGAYNVQNYNLSDRIVEGVYKANYPKPEAEKQALVEVISQANVDVLALSEIGGPAYLEELRTRLKTAGLDYPYSTIVNAPDSDRRLGLLSRIQFQPAHYTRVPHRYFDSQIFVLRGMLHVRFTPTTGRPWSLYAVHLKSRMTERPDDQDSQLQRVGEAQVLREIILKNTDTAPHYIIVGDFNDGPRSRTLQRFLSKGPSILSYMLEPMDSRGEVWTHRWQREGSYSRIDYLLVSPSMRPAVVPGSARIIDIPPAMQASDHRLVMTIINTQQIGDPTL